MDHVVVLKLPEVTVHHFAGRPDNVRKLLLRNLDRDAQRLTERLTVGCGQLHEGFRTAGGDREENRVFDGLVGLSQTFAQHPDDLHVDVRMGVQQREEITPANRQNLRILDHGRICGTVTAVEERDLAEEIAFSHDRQDDLPPLLGEDAYLDPALEDCVEAVPLLTAHEDRPILDVATDETRRQQLRQLPMIKRRK